MSTRRNSRIDRDTAEQLLRGAAMARPGAAADVARVLSAASAPPNARELAGEEAAVAAFRTARLGPVAAPAGRSRLQAAGRRLTTIQVAVVALATTSVLGGVAFAASTDTFPYQRDERPPASVTPDPARPSSQPTPTGPDDRPSTTPPGAVPSDRPARTGPAPSLVGQCRAYEARPPGKRRKALENPAFGALVAAAGGPDRVATYCTAVLGPDSGKPGNEPKPGKTPKTKPSPHGKTKGTDR